MKRLVAVSSRINGQHRIVTEAALSLWSLHTRYEQCSASFASLIDLAEWDTIGIRSWDSVSQHNCEGHKHTI